MSEFTDISIISTRDPVTLKDGINIKKDNLSTYPEENRPIGFIVGGDINLDPSPHYCIGHFKKEIQCENFNIIKNGFIAVRCTFEFFDNNIFHVYDEDMPNFIGVKTWCYLTEEKKCLANDK